MPTIESVIRRCQLLSAVIISVSAGCTQLSPTTPSSPRTPDVVAIITVVEDIYTTQGRGRMIFLGTSDDSIDEAELRQARVHLQTELGVSVKDASEADRSNPTLPALTPVDPETGEIGISIFLGPLTLDEDGRTRIEVSFSRSGRDGMVIGYVLESAPEGWKIIDRTTLAIS